MVVAWRVAFISGILGLDFRHIAAGRCAPYWSRLLERGRPGVAVRDSDGGL